MQSSSKSKSLSEEAIFGLKNGHLEWSKNEKKNQTKTLYIPHVHTREFRPTLND